MARNGNILDGNILLDPWLTGLTSAEENLERDSSPVTAEHSANLISL